MPRPPEELGTNEIVKAVEDGTQEAGEAAALETVAAELAAGDEADVLEHRVRARDVQRQPWCEHDGALKWKQAGVRGGRKGKERTKGRSVAFEL